MSTRLRAWLTLASIAALIALWSVVAFTGGFRFPYEEYVEAVAIYGSAGLFGLVLLLWRPPRFHGVRMDDPARISTDLVRRFGLRVEGKALVGESDGIEMHVSFGLQGRPHITLFGCGPIELSPQGMIARANDLRLGDEKFDRLATVKGDAAACHAALDDRTRRQWLAAAEQMPGLALSGGALRGTFADTPGISGEVEGAIRNLLSVAKRLRDVDVVAGLAANAESDSMPGVRLGCLRLLFTRYNDRPDCRRALEAALRDLDPEIRLFAAARCGRTGFDVLDALARDAHRPEAISG